MRQAEQHYLASTPCWVPWVKINALIGKDSNLGHRNGNVMEEPKELKKSEPGTPLKAGVLQARQM